MQDDPIIDEIRKIRDQLASQVDYDVRALGRKLQKKQKASRNEVVSFFSEKSHKEPTPKKVK